VVSLLKPLLRLSLVSAPAYGLALLLSTPASAVERPVLNAADFGTIDQALQNLPTDGGTVFVPAGVYSLSEKLRLRSNVELRGEGMEQTVLVLADGANDHLISNSSLTGGNTKIVIRDLGLRGNAANQSDWSFGVRLVNVTDALVDNVEASDFRKDGFYLGYNGMNGVRNVRVSNCRAVGNYRYGLALKHGTGNLVDGCSFEGNGFIAAGAAVKLGPDERLDASGNWIIGNRAIENYAGFVLWAEPGYESRVGENVVCGNHAEQNVMVGFQDFRGSNNLFFANVAQANGLAFDFGPTTRTEPQAADACAVRPLPEEPSQ